MTWSTICLCCVLTILCYIGRTVTPYKYVLYCTSLDKHLLHLLRLCLNTFSARPAVSSLCKGHFHSILALILTGQKCMKPYTSIPLKATGMFFC